MANKPVRALLLAAGLGTRLRPLTDSIPKCLAPLAGRPIVDYWLDLLGDAGISEARINIHTFPEQVRAWIAGHHALGAMQIAETFEVELRGSAGTVAHNRNFADDAEAVVIVYADNLSDVDLDAMLRYHRSHSDPVTMLLFHAPNPKACGIATLDSDRRIVRFVEKPELPESDLANAGVYIVDAATYREIAGMDAFDFGFDVLPHLDGRMRGWVWNGYHRDIGTPEAYTEAQQEAPRILARRGFAPDGTRRAMFLDRDGTIIDFEHYLNDPAKVRLIPGVAEAIRRLRREGFAVAVVSNQSGVARGFITFDQLHAVNREMCRQLGDHGACVDAIYFATTFPKTADRYSIDDPYRKPGPGMLLRGARELNVRVQDSYMSGDAISDVLAGENAGCRESYLITKGMPIREEELEMGKRFPQVYSLDEAITAILEAEDAATWA